MNKKRFSVERIIGVTDSQDSNRISVSNKRKALNFLKKLKTSV